MLSSDVGAVQPAAVTSRSQPDLRAVGELDRAHAHAALARPRCPRRAGRPRRGRPPRPARVRSATAASPSGLADSTTARSPGRTAWRLISRRTAVESITPGRSLPREDVGPLDQAGRDHEGLGPRLDQTLGVIAGRLAAAIEHRDPVAVVTAEHHGVGEHLDARLRGDLRRAAPRRTASSASPPQRRWPPSWCSSSTSRTEAPARAAASAAAIPAGPAAGDEHVGMGVALVVVAVRGVRRHRARRCTKRLSTPLVGRPGSSRLDEGLVVEAGGEEPAGELVDRLDVEAQRRPGVLGGAPPCRRIPAGGRRGRSARHQPAPCTRGRGSWR